MREGPPKLSLDAAARHAAVERLIADLVERQRRGQRISDSEVVCAHPELHPELSEAIGALRAIREALLDSREAGHADEVVMPLSLDDLEKPLDIADGERSPASDTDNASGDDFFPPNSEGDPVDPRLSIEGYELLEEVSDPKGTGQARVFRAIQRRTGRTVAVKVLHGGPYLSSKARKRYEREVRILGKLDHPNIVGVLDRARTADGSFFLVMEFVEGKQLDDYLETHRASLNLRDVVALQRKVVAAVAEAHRNGIVHRDLKPSNVRVDVHGEPHVLDFGLARLVREPTEKDASVTSGGHLVGTLLWASPEQVEGGGDRVREPSDVYSLGLMMYRVLSGRFPYPVLVPPLQIFENIRLRRPEPPSAASDAPFGAIDPQLEAILLKCLAKRPEDRYQNAGDLAEELRRYATDEPVRAPCRNARRRQRLLRWMAALLVATCAAWGVFAYVARPRPPTVLKLRVTQKAVGIRMVELPTGHLYVAGTSGARGIDGKASRPRLVPMTHRLEISETEVTRQQYALVMGTPRPPAEMANLPIDDVSWDDAVVFCQRLGAAENAVYRLPLEVEWEYACRAGRGTEYGGNNDLGSSGWYAENAGSRLHPVKQKFPNHWGLYDMHGNVEEWCLDVRYPTVRTSVPPERGAPDDRLGRVVRGGSIYARPERCTASHRTGDEPGRKRIGRGFRVVRGDLPSLQSD